MRILPERADHAGGCAAEGEAEAVRCGHRQRDAGEYLPVRDVPADSAGDQDCGGGEGMNRIERVSRRGFLGTAFGAGALVLVAIPLAREAATQTITGWGDAPFAVYIFPLIGLFLAPIYPAINSVILTTLPVNRHAVMSGLIVIFSALGGTTGSIITGQIFQHYGGETAFYFSLVPMTILLVCLFFFNRLQTKPVVVA